MSYYSEVDLEKDNYGIDGDNNYPNQHKHNWTKRNNRKSLKFNQMNQWEKIKADTRAKEIGEYCLCPICQRNFIKQAYNQVYCDNICREEFERRRWKKPFNLKKFHRD